MNLDPGSGRTLEENYGSVPRLTGHWSLRNIGHTRTNLSDKYEDLNWLGVQNVDLLKSILIKLRTRTARTAFKWVKGHEEENYGNNRADALANAGRENESLMRMDNENWIDNHPALQDGARLQALDA